jgi:TonB family protein
MRNFFALLTILFCMASGCASSPEKQSQESAFIADGAVSSEIVDTPGNERYEIRAGEQFFGEIPKRENARPTYPAALLAKQLDPVSVVARLVVSKSGEVERAEIIESTSTTADFSESVLVAVRTWTFIPLKRVVGSKIEPLPFTQDYKFTFKQENGRAVVVQGTSHDS